MSENPWIKAYCEQASENFTALSHQSEQIFSVALLIRESLEAGNKILFCGNGGSAADAQHLAAELVGHFKSYRDALSAIALTTDTSILTSVGNDLGFENIFARQVTALGKDGDILIAISTSGNSDNILRAVEAATKGNITTVGLTGKTGGTLATLCDHTIKVPSTDTNHIQEMHIAIGHMICAIAEGSHD